MPSPRQAICPMAPILCQLHREQVVPDVFGIPRSRRRPRCRRRRSPVTFKLYTCQPGEEADSGPKTCPMCEWALMCGRAIWFTFEIRPALKLA